MNDTNNTLDIDRRKFLATAIATCVIANIPPTLASTFASDELPIKIGLITDLHHDIMHDGMDRLKAFLKETKKQKCDAIMQMGDFAYPSEQNKAVIDLFNQSHPNHLHVIGNHDTDSGFKKEQCLSVWGMPSRYYTKKINGICLIVLDGNDKGSPTHKGGYASYINNEQRDWLKATLNEINEPIIIVSHQPIVGELAIDNAQEIQDILSEHANKILLAINGHTHINCMLRVKSVTYLHINSASYFWVGSKYPHATYPQSVLSEHKWIASTCPYKEPLFATLIINPKTLTVSIKGSSSSWVGANPAELGYNEFQSCTTGEEIAPKINDREIFKVNSKIKN
jgi:Icc protein